MKGNKKKVKDRNFRMKASEFDSMMGRALGAPRAKHQAVKRTDKKASKK